MFDKEGRGVPDVLPVAGSSIKPGVDPGPQAFRTVDALETVDKSG